MVVHDVLSATREAYDAAAPAYAQLFSGELRDRPLDRAILSAFAEVVSASGDGQVASHLTTRRERAERCWRFSLRWVARPLPPLALVL